MNVKAVACNRGKLRLSTEENNKEIVINIQDVKQGLQKIDVNSLTHLSSQILLETVPNDEQESCYITVDSMQIQ